MTHFVAQSIARAGDFRLWNQEDWQYYVKYGKDKEDDRERVLSPLFQRAMVEVGIFGGAEFFKRAPRLLIAAHERDSLYFNDFAELSRSIPYARPITRFSIEDRQQLEFNLDERGIRLQEVDFPTASGRTKRVWVIERPILNIFNPYNPAPRNIGSAEDPVLVNKGLQLLIEFPEIYAQIVALMNVDKVAMPLLAESLPQGIVNLALEYAGYPQYSGERFYEMQNALWKLFSDDGSYTHHTLRVLPTGHDAREVVEIVTTIADFVGFDDREGQI